MIDRHPALIACYASEADVITAMYFARENRLLAAVRGGGHKILLGSAPVMSAW
jgi:FAD/FMN-containing dehydrogenase